MKHLQSDHPNYFKNFRVGILTARMKNLKGLPPDAILAFAIFAFTTQTKISNCVLY